MIAVRNVLPSEAHKAAVLRGEETDGNGDGGGALTSTYKLWKLMDVVCLCVLEKTADVLRAAGSEDSTLSQTEPSDCRGRPDGGQHSSSSSSSSSSSRSTDRAGSSSSTTHDSGANKRSESGAGDSRHGGRGVGRNGSSDSDGIGHRRASLAPTVELACCFVRGLGDTHGSDDTDANVGAPPPAADTVFVRIRCGRGAGASGASSTWHDCKAAAEGAARALSELTFDGRRVSAEVLRVPQMTRPTAGGVGGGADGYTGEPVAAEVLESTAARFERWLRWHAKRNRLLVRYARP